MHFHYLFYLLIFYQLLLLLSSFSHVQLCKTPQTSVNQAPPSLGFSRQEYRSGLPFPSPVHACMLSHFSHVLLCATPWTAAHQAPLSMGFSRQEYWSGLSFPSPDSLLGYQSNQTREANKIIKTDAGAILSSFVNGMIVYQNITRGSMINYLE